MDAKPIRLAIIGAGLFARDHHVPAIQALGSAFQIVAVGSRTRASAERLAKELPGEVDAYDDVPLLLARDDVEAVDLVLPIHVLPEAIEMALAAGKHVISEKPMAPDVATGRRLLATYARYPKQVWMVAEHLRYETAFVHAAEAVKRGEIGKPLVCHRIHYTAMTPANKYYHTAWRRAQVFPGGYVLDAGVHHMAELRMTMGEVVEVRALGAQMRPDLPPIDTLGVALRFESGALGTYVATYAAEAPWPSSLHIAGERGAVSVHTRELTITSERDTRRVSFDRSDGVRGELAAFAAAIRLGTPHRDSPQETWQDLALMEAMLRAAASGQPMSPERIV